LIDKSLSDEQEEARALEELGDKMAAWEKRIEARPDPEPEKGLPTELPPKPEKKKALVRWAEKLHKDQVVYLFLGSDPDKNCPVLFAQPYRVSGSRENGKLILKPAKIEPVQEPANQRR